MAFRPEPFFLPFLFLYKSASTVIFPFSPFLVILYPILNCPPLRDILSLPRSLSLSSIMTPVYQQPPFVDQKDEDQRLKLFGFSSNQASSSLSWAAYLNTGRDQRGCGVEDHPSRQILHDDPKVGDSFFFGASTDRMVISSPSSSLPPEVCEEKTTVVSGNGEEDHSSKRELNGSLKWMSSKMRIMQKMVNKEAEARQDFGNRQYQKSGMNSSSSNNNNNTIRVCSDCKTTTTPLWRSGPQGPKSLCNACGIRQRKARRAMAEAAGATANSTVVSSDSPSLKQNKEKKSRTTSHVGQNKAKFKLPDSVNGERRLSFNNIALSLSETSAFERVFPRDEEEGAILLMELSCGFVHG